MIDYKSMPWLDKETARNSETGRFITESLFLETNQTNYDMIRWCLTEWEKEKEGKFLPSAYQVILHADDEYDAAMKICGSWSVWNRMKANKRLWNGVTGQFPGIAAALEEQKHRKNSESLKLIKDSASNGNVAAQKYLHELSKTTQKGKKKQVNTADKDNEADKVVALVNRLKT